MISSALLLLGLLGCGATGHSGAAEPAPVPSPPTAKEPTVSEFTDGPSPADAAALRAWLKQAGKRRLQLPMVVTVQPLGGVSATIGDGGPSVSIDSSALSRTLPDHLREHCGDASPCHVWLEGTWGPLVGPAIGGDTFAVRKVVGKVDDPAAARPKVHSQP